MVYSRNWDETDPDGAVVDASDIDLEIREFKEDVRERIEQVVPDWADDGVDPKTLDASALDDSVISRSFPRVRLLKTATQSVADGDTDDVTWDSEDFDTDDFADLATDNTLITIPAGFGGLYLITFEIGFELNATGERQIRLRTGGTSADIFLAAQREAIAQYNTRLRGTTIMELSDGASFWMEATVTNAGSAVNLDPITAGDFLSAIRLGG